VPRLALLILLLIAPALAAQDDDAARVPGLIEQLASDEWRTRERASRDLIGIGEAARHGLREALTNDDPEVRVRASAALIEIGETFTHAVQCATSEDKNLIEHGRAALMNLFRIDEPKVLRELTQQEMQPRGFMGGPQLRIMKPPKLAIAQLTAQSGMSLIVADEVAEPWARIMQQPTLAFDVPGGGAQIQYLRNALNASLNNALGKAQNHELTARPMRLGRTTFIYVTRVAGGANIAQRCAGELIAMLLGGGAAGVRAAALLAQGAAGDTVAAGRIRKEYEQSPSLDRLMWLALALEADAATQELVRRADPAVALELLGSLDWTAVEMAARFLVCLGAAERGAALSPRIASASDAMEVTVALWLARDCPLDAPARERARKLLASRQDSLAAAAARWFAGAESLSDDELEAVWKAGEIQTLASEFFLATLELVSRAGLAERLEQRARAALSGTLATQQALAAQVLSGRAQEQDVVVVMGKLGGAKGDPLLARRLCELLNGVSQLPEASEAVLVNNLVDTNAQVRKVYLRALRALDAPLRVAVCDKVDARTKSLAGFGDAGGTLDITSKDYKEGPLYVMQAHIAILGIRGGAGDLDALEQLSRHAEGDNAELAKSAGAAVVDALQGEMLFKTLDDWKTRIGLTQGMAAAVEAYTEICRRAAEQQDRATFRRAFGVITSINVPNSYQVRNELARLQAGMSADPDGEKQRVPKTLNLNQAEVDVQ
jgi:hypothetical protein